MTIRMPPPLCPGDHIAVIAPASAPHALDDLDRGLDALRRMDYTVEVHFDANARRGYLAAPDADRLAVLNDCLHRTDLHAILCVRGGYGTMRLLPQVDYAAARRHPKLLVGYSDITALQAALYAKAGWTSLSGPVLTEWHKIDARGTACLRALAAGDMPDLLAATPDATLQPLRPGMAEGPLVGGNLSVLTRLLGTPYELPMENAILFLEDVGEVPYRVDRMLAHLALAGVLDALAGVLIGGFSTGDVRSPSLTLMEVFADYFGDRPYPVVTGLPYGHFMPRAFLPIGARARLTATGASASFELLTPVTEKPTG